MEQFAYDHEIVTADALPQSVVDRGRQGLEVVNITPWAYGASETYELVVSVYLVLYRIHPDSVWPLT